MRVENTVMQSAGSQLTGGGGLGGPGGAGGDRGGVGGVVGFRPGDFGRELAGHRRY